MGTLIFIGVIVAVIIYIIAVYNRLIALKNRFKNGFAQIDVQLQRRHDLIPNLVETAKAYMSHEKDTLTQVIEARNQAVNAKKTAADHPDDTGAVRNLGKAESLLSGSLANFFALSENYPDLKANETYREQFPQNFIGGLFGSFKEAQLLKIETEEARQAVKVTF